MSGQLLIPDSFYHILISTSTLALTFLLFLSLSNCSFYEFDSERQIRKKLFWSNQQDENCPSKEDDKKEDKLLDQFWIHVISFPDCVFLQYSVWRI